MTSNTNTATTRSGFRSTTFESTARVPAHARPALPAGAIGELATLSLKLALAQLAPLVASLYLSALVAAQGPMVFSSYSLVTTVNLTLFIAASSFLQVLYYVAGRAKGYAADGEYDGAMSAGVVMALTLAAVGTALSCMIGIILDALQLDAELVAGARWQGMLAAVGIAPTLLLVVYRVHASLNRRAGFVTLLAGAGAALAAAFATWAVWRSTGEAEHAVAGVLLSIAAANWLMLLVALASLRCSPELRRSRDVAGATRPPLRQSIALMCAVGWPVGAVVLLDSLASLVTALFVGRYWVAAVPVNAVVLLWVAVGLVIPLGMAQAAVQRVAVTHAEGDRATRNRLATVAMAMGVGYGVLAVAFFALVPVPMGALLLHHAAYEPENVAMLRALMIPGGIVLALQGLIVIAAAILRGIGQTRAPLVQAFIGYSIIGTGSQALFGLVLGYGATGVWWGLVLGFAVTAVAVTWRCWHELGRVQPTESHPPVRNEHPSPALPSDSAADAARAGITPERACHFSRRRS
jgi:MATE family multidrug resistance protein